MSTEDGIPIIFKHLNWYKSRAYQWSELWLHIGMLHNLFSSLFFSFLLWFISMTTIEAQIHMNRQNPQFVSHLKKNRCQNHNGNVNYNNMTSSWYNTCARNGVASRLIMASINFCDVLISRMYGDFDSISAALSLFFRTLDKNFFTSYLQTLKKFMITQLMNNQ